MARTVAIRCIFCAEDMPKIFLWQGLAPDPAGGAYSTPTDHPAAVCRYVYGLEQGPGKMLMCPGK